MAMNIWCYYNKYRVRRHGFFFLTNEDMLLLLTVYHAYIVLHSLELINSTHFYHVYIQKFQTFCSLATIELQKVTMVTASYQGLSFLRNCYSNSMY